MEHRGHRSVMEWDWSSVLLESEVTFTVLLLFAACVFKLFLAGSESPLAMLQREWVPHDQITAFVWATIRKTFPQVDL